MGASSRPGGRPRRPGPSDQIRATGTRHRRYVRRRAPDPGPRAAWVFAVIALVAGAGMIVFIAFEGSGRRIAVGPSATPVLTAPVRSASPAPTDALAVTGEGDGGPVASPVRTPVTRATPAPTPTPATGPEDRELQVEFPEDGEVVVSGRINVFGRAPGGTRVLRLLADGSIETTAARPDGLWILGVDLEPGENELRFRVEGSDAEPIVVRVTYQPR